MSRPAIEWEICNDLHTLLRHYQCALWEWLFILPNANLMVSSFAMLAFYFIYFIAAITTLKEPILSYAPFNQSSQIPGHHLQ